LLVQTANGIVVYGEFDTTVNGGQCFTAVGVTGDIQVDLGAGDDTLAMGFVAPHNLTIDLGAGNDALFFGGFFDAPLPGATEFSVHVTGDLRVRAGDGNDALFMFEAQVDGKADINLGEGDDFALAFLTTFGG